MVRARLFRVALAAALGLACGCSTPSSCSSCPGSSFTSRLTSLFRRDRASEREIGCCPIDGPVIADPGCCDGPGCAAGAPQPFPPMPQSFPPPPLAAVPQPLPTNEAQRLPYQP